MPALIAQLRRAMRTPPRELLRKIRRRIGLGLGDARRRRRDQRHATISVATPDTVAIARYFPAAIDPYPDRRDLAELFLAHRFDLLGSGWVEVRHGLEASGLEGHAYPAAPPVHADSEGRWLDARINAANRPVARALWALVDPGYVPIDWHIDFKSGFRWREDCWYRDIVVGPAPGADIKLPWELARMQHLPQLALLYLELADPVCAEAEALRREFRNQVLDFLATNPPRFGVNWACAMEVAIRAANWLVAYDIFRQAGAAFDPAFEAAFAASIEAHAAHIAANLEWINGHRGNHYLADIVGLLFCAAYLPSSPRVDAWLAFAVQELGEEILAQFHPDGGNFEASTVYHRLSAEMVVYGAALVLALPPERIATLQSYDATAIRTVPPLRPGPLALHASGDQLTPFAAAHWQRIARAAQFTRDVTRPNGEVIQVGDNDSGRFLKLFPSYMRLTVGEARARFVNLVGYRAMPDDATYLLENHLDHAHLLAAAAGLLGCADSAAGAAAAEARLVRDLARAPAPGAARAQAERPSPSGAAAGAGTERVVTTAFRAGRGRLRDGLAVAAYPDFGLYIYHSPDLFLAIRCGQIGLNGLGPHDHNDQLSVELWIEGRPVIVDPGTYVYTPLPARRNEFRAVSAHFGPYLAGVEPGDLGVDIFALGNAAHGACLRFDEERFVGRFAAGDGHIYRQIDIATDGIALHDWTTAKGHVLGPLVPPQLYSAGYGWWSTRGPSNAQ